MNQKYMPSCVIPYEKTTLTRKESDYHPNGEGMTVKDAIYNRVKETNNMKKAMISQPMSSLTDEEIMKTRQKAIEYLKNKNYIVINTYSYKYDDPVIEDLNKPLYYLSQSLLRMSGCDTVYFCKGWESVRGCKIEHEAAKAYGLEIIYEEWSCEI